MDSTLGLTELHVWHRFAPTLSYHADRIPHRVAFSI